MPSTRSARSDRPIMVAVIGGHHATAAEILAELGPQIEVCHTADLNATRASSPDAVVALLAGDGADGATLELLGAIAYQFPSAFRLALGPTLDPVLLRRALNDGHCEAYLPSATGRAELAAVLCSGAAHSAQLAGATDAHVDDHHLVIAELEGHLAACQVQLTEAHERLRATRNEMTQLELQSSISQLVRGLAHELNNPLTAILGHAQRLRIRANDGEDVKRRAGVLSNEAERCIALVERLRSLAAPLREAMTPCQVGTVVGMACERLDQRRIAPPPIAFRRQLPPIVAGRQALARCLEQVFDNAILARAKRIWIDGDIQSGRLLLRIDNDGKTISDEEIRHGLRPFYTTRSDEGHHGLGLSLASSLLHEMGGSIMLDRGPQAAGTRCTIVLPCIGEAQDPTPSRGVPILTASIVLVIDDEPLVAELLTDLVDDLGHQVAVCGDRATALERLQAGDIRAVLCDVKLPDGDGCDLLAKALRRWPRLVGHCALITGDATNPLVRDRAQQLGTPLIGKPFHLAEIQAILRAIL